MQIENEYYSPVRPKRVARSGEQPTAALRRDGIEYVEVRSLDLNMFDPAGVNQNTMRFIEAFLIYCLLEDSPPIDAEEFERISHNHTGTAKRGRDPAFRLRRGEREVRLQTWAGEILDKVLAVAETIDRQGDNYSAAIRQQRAFVDDPATTASARIVAELEQSGRSFFDFALAIARCHRDYFATIAPLGEAREAVLAEEAVASRRRQAEIEAADTITLDDYLQRYFDAF